MAPSVAPRRGRRALARRAAAWAGLLAAITTITIGTTGPARARAARSGPDPRAIDRFVTGRLAATRIPGMALAVTQGSRVVHLKGYGHDGRGDPVTPDTQFCLASLSKSFTALAVMRLVESGRITLDEPVWRHLPGFTVADRAAGRRITVRHLLDQTSGLADGGFRRIADDRPPDLARRVADLREAHLVSEPGRRFHYTDLNYQVLGRLVEVVAGRPLPDHLRDEVFAPLGMSGTVAVTRSQEGRRAAPRLAEGSVLAYGLAFGRPELTGLLAGSSGVISSARDMAHWLIFQGGDGRFGGARLLSAAGMRTMHTPPAGVRTTYAMGWLAESPRGAARRYEHDGVLSTFHADQVLLPDSGIGIALLYPASSALAGTDGIKEGLIALLTGRKPPAVGFMDGRVVAALLGALTLATVVLRTRALLRIRRWTAGACRRGWWWSLPGLVWQITPAVLVPAMPALLGAAIGRYFSFGQIFLAMPDVLTWLCAGAVLGTALAGVRAVALVRCRRGGLPVIRPGAPADRG